MRARLLGALATAAVAASLLGAGSASAATEVGSDCQVSDAAEGYTFVPLSIAPGAHPLTVPTAGVVTRWRSNFPPEGLPPNIISQTLKVFRGSGAGGQFQVIGESLAGGIVDGANTFLTRIPVLAGDRFGLTGNPTTLYCETGNPGDVMAVSELSAAVGGIQQLEAAEAGLQVPVVAIVEPDIDGDGFGDETQDKCPQSAVYQVPCPVVILSALTQPGAKAVTVSVATSLNTSVTVSGSVKLGKGATAKLKAVTAGVAPGTFGKFKLQFPSNLQKRLKELTPKQKLTLKLTASAANITGPASTSSFNAKLKGQG